MKTVKSKREQYQFQGARRGEHLWVVECPGSRTAPCESWEAQRPQSTAEDKTRVISSLKDPFNSLYLLDLFVKTTNI